MQVVDTISNTEWQAAQIQISWLLQKPTDLDLHCLQRQDISGFGRTRIKVSLFSHGVACFACLLLINDEWYVIWKNQPIH